MAPSTIYIRASTSLTSSSNPSVLRSLASTSIKRSRHVPVRSLWWWSRHGTWSSANDESIEERIQRHNKIMRHRYSRALRRRAMWDRDEGLSAWLNHDPDARLARKWGGCRTMSSTNPHMAKVEDKHDSLSQQQKLWAETQRDFDSLNKDFESFKAAIDRAIEKDPYGTLFGRRVQSPPSENNSSWISWLFNRGTTTSEPNISTSNSSTRRKIEIEVRDGKGSTKAPKAPEVSKVVPITSMAQMKSAPPVEYVYDPISGRKVPKGSDVIKSTSQPKQTFLEKLFSEHGAAPDKPIKQSRVSGHDANSSKREVVNKDAAKQSPALNPGFQSSRTYAYNQLRAAMLGNNIDTTAEFGGKFTTEVSNAVGKPVKREDDLSTSEDTAPLFSGTTYETKATEIVPDSAKPQNSWLAKEGFQDQEKAPKHPTGDPDARNQRLQPAFERMQQVTETSHTPKSISKLQPAIDRVQLVKVKDDRSNIATAIQMQTEPLNLSLVPDQSSAAVDTREDVDLLRASDVRAATKAARTTKQEITRAKSELRTQLEADFDKLDRQAEGFVANAKQLREQSNRVPRSLDDAWKHAEKHPDGVVAKTMKSIGIASEKFRNYTIPYQASRVDLTERLEFPNDSLEKLPSIYKNKVPEINSNIVQTSPNAVAEELSRQNLTESLRSLTKNANEAKRRDDVQIEQLADGIRQVYEAEYGPIDLPLAQSSQSNGSAEKVASAEESATKPREATSAPDQSTEFLAERNKFLSEVNTIAKDVGSIKTKATQLENELKNELMGQVEFIQKADKLTAEAKSQNKKIDELSNSFEASHFSQQSKLHPLSTATVKPGVPRYPAIERHTTVFEPKYIQMLSSLRSVRVSLQEVSTNLHDLKRSKVTEDKSQSLNQTVPKKESAPKPESQVKPQAVPKVTDLSSPYLILVYNKATGEIDQTTMDRLPWSSTEKAEKSNPIKIMGNLNYPAAFVTHFGELEKAGYGLASGGGDMLIFQKLDVKTPPAIGDTMAKPVVPASKFLRNNIATEESLAQPEITETIAQPKGPKPKEAATVLDEIPVEVPNPGPAAPTAPPANPLRKTPRPGPKVRRQESVFSGTIPVRPAQATKQDQNKQPDENNSQEGANEQDPGLFARTTRSIQRGVLGVAAFGTVAYIIGVVAEGIGAQAQVDQDAVTGPRTKVVMPVRQRPGIYSTESSRE